MKDHANEAFANRQHWLRVRCKSTSVFSRDYWTFTLNIKLTSENRLIILKWIVWGRTEGASRIDRIRNADIRSRMGMNTGIISRKRYRWICYMQWLKWSCVAGGGLTWRIQIGANPIPIPHTTNLALFGHKITLYRFNQGAHTIAGGSNWSRELSPPGPLTLTTGYMRHVLYEWSISDTQSWHFSTRLWQKRQKGQKEVEWKGIRWRQTPFADLGVNLCDDVALQDRRRVVLRRALLDRKFWIDLLALVYLQLYSYLCSKLVGLLELL